MNENENLVLDEGTENGIKIGTENGILKEKSNTS